MALFPTLYFLKDDEQLLVEGPTTRRMIDGPRSVVVPALSSGTKQKAMTLAPTEYVRVRNTLTGELRNVLGPRLFFMDVNDEVVAKLSAITLKQGQYVRLIDQRTGVIRVERGEQMVYIEPTEELITKPTNGVNVDENSAVLVRNLDDGQYELVTIPQVFIPAPNQEVIEVRKRVLLENNEYARILDRRTGVIRVERGEQSFFLDPYEEIIEMQEGINVDEERAVLVRDTDSGQLDLITEPQVFFPDANQEIVEERHRLRLEDHETVVVKDENGRYVFRRGTDDDRSFFIPPHHNLVSFRWSSGLTKEKRELSLSHIDSRPKYMWYNFEVRTEDNVELIIGITFFWQIFDVEQMIKTTDDTTGDICAHARSRIIQAVSRTTLELFLAEFNSIVERAVLDETDPFYGERGVRLLAIEVRSIVCKDPETQRILQEIIQETTNRLNRLQKQESENEVKIRQVQGSIEAEEERRRLLEIQRENAQTVATTTGESEAQKVLTFLDGLGGDVSLEDKITLFNVLRKTDMLRALSSSTAQLYFTPSDVDLSIDTRPPSRNGR